MKKGEEKLEKVWGQRPLVPKMRQEWKHLKDKFGAPKIRRTEGD